MVVISAAVEGITDEAIVRKLIEHAGAQSGPVYGKKGKPNLREKIVGYNNAARHSPWFVLVDLDNDANCALPLRQAWLPELNQALCFRIAVRAVEAWLLADAQTLAKFLRVARSEVPLHPEGLVNPKAAMVTLAGKSKNKNILSDMVPRAGSGLSIGPAYTSRLIEYASLYWRPDIAANNADSLRRAIACLQRLVNT